ncbi:cation:proton antiporter [Methylotuvimicrobium sp.]|uniref:cation:proton antiporter domain-containing protein n=1 Tax=Methylotuvimicrobium sp. TaxID=2822413 RepID=UPI003D652AA0
MPAVFLFIDILLISAKTCSLIEKVGQPAILGELLLGLALGNLGLIGIDFFEAVTRYVFFDNQTLLTAWVLTLVAVVGIGMVPRGEVGLVFAMSGHTTGILSAEVFSVIVLMAIITTLMTPPLLSYLLKKHVDNH